MARRRPRFGLAGASALACALLLQPVPTGAMAGDWEHPFPMGGMDGPIYAMEVFQGQLIAAGLFSSAGGKPASNIARWDGERWWPLGEGIYNGSPEDGFTPYLNGLCVHDGNLVATGAFTRAGEALASNVAWWDGSAWHPIGGTFNGIVYTADSYGGELFVGGRFTRIDGILVRYFAFKNGTQWRTPNVGVNELVSATAHWDGRLVAAGAFTRADNIPASGVAVWNGAWWEPLGQGVSGGEPRTWVFALAVFRGELIAGGVFTHADGRQVNGIARWDGTTWQPLGSGILSREDVWVFALASYRDRLIAAGAFTHAGGERVDYIAAWDGSTWSDLDGGTDSWVRSLCVLDARLYVAGHFGTAGGKPAARIARWNSGPVPVSLVEFSAVRMDASRARIRILTSAAAAVTAFHVHRTAQLDSGVVPGGSWTRITAAPVSAAPGLPLTVDDPAAPAASAAYWLEELRLDASTWHGPTLLVPSDGGGAMALALAPLAPNPFGEATRIDFALPRATATELRVLDVRGRTVARLLDAALGPGEHSVTWDGRDASGGRAAQGVYVVRLRAGGHERVRRVTLTGR